MANEDSVILKEVDQALEEDQTLDFFRKNGTALIAGAIAIVAGVGGWQFWNHMKTEAAQVQALEYRNACFLYTPPSPRDATLSRMPFSACKKKPIV